MKRLSKEEYWDSRYNIKSVTDGNTTFKKDVKSFLKKYLNIFSKFIYKLTGNKIHNYREYITWNILYKKYLPNEEGLKVIEIGSAPGNYLVKLNRSFGYIPYGIEYSPKGAELNREVFRENNLDPGNVINADFFSEDFQRQYNEYFDIVVSRGFIEHFTDVKSVVDKHINLLKKGGLLMITIPNLRWMNFILGWFFNRKFLKMHNLEIMKKDVFSRLFDENELSTKYCDYFGTFHFGLFFAERNSLIKYIHIACMQAQNLLNLCFRLLFGDKGAESRYFSPNLIFIGIKK